MTKRRLTAAAERPPQSPFCRERTLHAPRARPHPVRRLPQCARERQHHRIPAAPAHAVLSRDDGVADRRRRRARRRPRRCRGRRAAVDAAGPDVHARRSCGTATACAGRSKTPRSSRSRTPEDCPTACTRCRSSCGCGCRTSRSSTSPRPTPSPSTSPSRPRRPALRSSTACRLYSFMTDYGTVLDLETAMAGIADIGATGIEILGEGHIPNYPNPSQEWVDDWFRAAGEVRPRAHQLRLVDRHPPALQRPERPRHDRRGGRRGAAARPPAREAARVPVRPSEDRRGLERPRAAPDLDRGRREHRCRWPKSST